MSPENVSIILAGGATMYRQSLGLALSRCSGLVVLADVSSSSMLFTVAHSKPPDVLVLNSALRPEGPIPTLRRVGAEFGRTVVIVHSVYPFHIQPDEVQDAGGSGHIDDDASIEDLLHAIDVSLSGRFYNASGDRMDGEGGGEADRQRFSAEPDESPLSPREIDVLRRLAEGRRTSEIASDLFISEKTVEIHRGHIAAKLRHNTIADMTRYAIRAGFVSLAR